MAALPFAEESGRACQADAREHVSAFFLFKNKEETDQLECYQLIQKKQKKLECYSIRFSPPLVISEEHLQRGIEIIKQALNDLDEVCISGRFPFCGLLTPLIA